MDLSETVTSVSNHVFPGLSHKVDNSLLGNQVLSNLPLQMALYFNAIFAPIWIIVIVLFLVEKIPELAGFWMLSVFLQLPLQGFLLFNPHFGFYISEVIVQSVMFTMLCIQVISGYCALRYTAAQQATYFRTVKLRPDISLADLENRYRIK
ncbi:hypothetical protein NQ314_010121 [Rhamnusium bicolor]|uniref:Uncharacterized protein n=1 Tax=Rhamnusium bicolor TaxID=1586634 RepID=A0AAV8XTM2_9CUCU|nr:hypothetical protein NQ314_010121 [Rhamnusium bicolor]